MVIDVVRGVEKTMKWFLLGPVRAKPQLLRKANLAAIEY